MDVVAGAATRSALPGLRQLAVAAGQEARGLFGMAGAAKLGLLVRGGDAVGLDGSGGVAVRLALAVAGRAIDAGR